MAWSEAGSWDRDGARLDPAGIGKIVGAVLERTEVAHRRSAARLRACGHVDRACRIEQSAAWARFDLDEPVAARWLYVTADKLRRIRCLQPLADKVLGELLSLAHADRGNVQLADPGSGALRIIAQYGFDEEFLDHFAVVTDGGSACGRAARNGAQLVIRDVRTDPGFEPHRDIAAASGFRAVLSTPLLDRVGHLVGVLSTHYPRPNALPDQNMHIIQRYADLTGQILATRLCAASQPHPATSSNCCKLART